MHRGLIKVSDLNKNDYVKSYDSNKMEWTYSRFIFFLHKDDESNTEYISIKTSSNKNLLISSMHLIAKKSNNNNNNNIEYVLAKDLKQNDILISSSNDNDEIIIDLNKVIEKGAYAPLLESGTISVNNILASCYANTKWHKLAHFAFQPIIKISNYFNVDSTTTTTSTNDLLLPNGVNWYVRLLSSFLPYIPMSSNLVTF